MAAEGIRGPRLKIAVIIGVNEQLAVLGGTWWDALDSQWNDALPSVRL